MSSVEARFLEPLDVLFLRGNKLFGDPGSFGESLVPPWPSVAAGALRSRMLADDQVDLTAFARGEVEHPTLGKPEEPGAFTVTAFHLARRRTDGTVEMVIQPPADLVISRSEDGRLEVRSLTPTQVPGAGLISSAPFAKKLPVLAEKERSKPVGDHWLTESGWKKYLAGETPKEDADWVKPNTLWKLDHRIGVGLDAGKRSAAEGRLFSVQAVALVKQGHRIGTDEPILADYDVGFLAAITGGVPPKDGTVRLGGDGRAAAVHAVEASLAAPDYEAIVAATRCRLVLTTPGLFEHGWLPAGVTREAEGAYRFELHGVKGRLVCAAVPRAEVVSGWDVAKWQPKPARRAAPSGSVYWLEVLEATPEALGKLAGQGLWSDPCEDTVRRVEGFNRVAIAAW